MRRILPPLIIAALFSPVGSLIAQTPLTHEKKVYVNEAGKTYWNKNLPVYVRLSTSPDENDKGHLLKSEKSKQYVDPYFLDTEGINYIRSSWAVDKKTGQTVMPKIDVMWEVYADGVAPATQLMLDEKQVVRKKNKVLARTGTTVQFAAKDATSGVDTIYFSLNGEPYQPYTQPLQLTDEKIYTISYYAIDRVGNAETPQKLTIVVDTRGPKTAHNLSGNFTENVLASTAAISLTTEDDPAGIYVTRYHIDEGPLVDYQRSIPVANLADGEHTITYYSIDDLKNQESPTNYTFYVDKTAPFVTAEIMGDHFVAGGKEYSSGRSQIKLAAVDNKAGIQEIYYSINGGSYQPYEKPFFLPSKAGSIKLDYYAVDKVGNKSQNTAGGKNLTAPYLDLSAPSLSYTFSGPVFTYGDTVYISSSTKIRIDANDTESGLNKITYSLNKQAEQDYNQPFSVTEEGFHQIDFFGYDQVNNRNRSRFTFAVDKEGPTIFEHFGRAPLQQKEATEGSLQVYPEHVSLFLAATDYQVGYEKLLYSVNGGAELLYNAPLKGFQKGKDYKILIRSVDKLGNQNTKEVVFGVY